MNLKKQQLKGVKIIGAPQVGTRTVNILMGEHAGEYVRGDIMDANAVIQAFDELKGDVDENHDTIEELVNEIHSNSASVQRIEAESKERDNQEAQARKDADNAESERATQVEANLGQAILDEEAARKNADDTLASNLSAEIARAKAAEKSNADRIDIIDGDSSVEGSYRKAIKDLINGAPEAYDTLKEIADKLQDNDDLHQAIEEAIATKAAKTDLNAEIARAKNAEQANTDAIVAETTRATGKENELLAAINAEANRAKVAENANAEAISAEATRAKSAEGTLENSISSEVTRAKTAEETLQANINNEAAARKSADDAISASVTAETTRATAVEDTKVDKVEGKQLSTNDYTTDEKNKLANIEAGANNYIHPTSAAGAISSGLYKITTDEDGHITAVTNVEQSDITALGIPANSDIEAISDEFINSLT